MLHSIALTFLRGITQGQALELLRHLPSIQLLFDSPDEALSELHPQARLRISAALREHRSEALERAAAEVEFCERHAIAVLPITSAAYPQRLAECPDAPAVLYYRGTACWDVQHVLSIVGTRRITPYGKDICQQLVGELAQRLPDVLIVSGLAYGVDVHAHRACLAHGVSTVGVLAHGLDQIYPSSHRETAKAMLNNGGLLTEYARGTRPLAGHFVRRNRIVAGLSDATIVVESADKGGALITARLASDYHRLVAAFPGRVGDPYSVGCNRLIREQNAALITSAADLLDVLGWASPATTTPAVQLDLFPTLNAEQQRVVDALRATDGLSVAQLCVRTNLEQSVLHAQLFELEMSGVVQLLAGGLYRLLPQVHP